MNSTAVRFWRTFSGEKYQLHSAHKIPLVPRCSRTHGHTWKLKVKVGYDSPEFVDFKEISDDILQILNLYDHENLGETTCEELAFKLAKEISENLNGLPVILQINETPSYGIEVHSWET